jgi:hypothetical protein
MRRVRSSEKVRKCADLTIKRAVVELPVLLPYIDN